MARWLRRHFLALVVCGALAGCVTVRQTDPPVTATQQLLVSAAVDRSVKRLKVWFPPEARVFLETQYVDGDAVSYPKYTLGAVRARLLELGAHLVNEREAADIVVELRSGAQSVNARNALLGIPSVPIPIPFVGTFTIPELALFKLDRQIGVSKVAIDLYAREDGRRLGGSGPQFGESRYERWGLLLFSWTIDDLRE